MIEFTSRSGEPVLAGQTVVVIGGVSGIGLEIARLARREGADLVITGNEPDRLQRVGLELGARIAAVDEIDRARVERFFAELPEIDYVVVGQPYPAAIVQHLAQTAAPKIQSGGALIVVSEGVAEQRARVRVHSLAGEAADDDDVAAAAIHLMTTG